MTGPAWSPTPHGRDLRHRLFVPFILLTFLMAYVVQEMTVRLGGDAPRPCRTHLPTFRAFWGYFAMGDLVFGNVLTLVTEFIAIQAGGLYFGSRPACRYRSAPPWFSLAGVFGAMRPGNAG